MALKKVDTNQYIKIELDGSFAIYSLSKERLQEKKATAFEKVVQFYQTTIASLWKNKERIYYDASFKPLVLAWEAEYEQYLLMHRYGQKSKNFPLIKKYIKDIEKTLPEIVCRGQIGVTGTTLQEIYEEVKRLGLFGQVEDC